MTVFSPANGRTTIATGPDRRTHSRRAISPRLYVILDGSQSDGILNDASESGIQLDIVGPTPGGERINVDFEMSEIGQRFEAAGRITWRDESAKRIGIHFDDLPESARTQIRKWLAVKAAAAEPVARPLHVAAERDTSSVVTRILPPTPVIVPQPARPISLPKTENLKQVLAAEPVAVPEMKQPALPVPPPPRPQPVVVRKGQDDRGEQLVRNLVESFNKPHRRLRFDLAALAAKLAAMLPRSSRTVIALSAAAILVVALAFGVAARRTPQAAPQAISVSKAGRSAGVEPAVPGDSAEQSSPPNSLNTDTVYAGALNGNQNASSSNANLGAAGLWSSLPPALAASLPKSGRSACVNLGAPADKIRVFLWAEKDTPALIPLTYAKYLKAVSDIRLVDSAPYDLVLYVNGANTAAKSSAAGFIWSSRAFRPWYCGQSLGLLEKTEVNESLHYVQGASLDSRVQAEVAYLILHTFESIRNERAK